MLRRSLQDPLLWSWLDQVSDDDFLGPQDLAAIRQPLHVVFGRQERLFPDRSREFWRAHLPAGAVFEEPEGFGHSPYLDDRQWAVDRILALASRV